MEVMTIAEGKDLNTIIRAFPATGMIE